jgi:hypothetical protein
MVSLAAAAGLAGLGQVMAHDGDGNRDSGPPRHLSGLINDFTPSAAGGIGGGPYEMRGKWTLDLDGDRDTARFSAVLDMETSDYGMTAGNVDIPMGRGAHVHHIILDRATRLPDTSMCPLQKPAVTSTAGFAFMGDATVTVNGGPPPPTAGFTNPSSILICVQGNSNVALSNFTLQFLGTATVHFGKNGIHGVVVRCSAPHESDCTVQD